MDVIIPAMEFRSIAKKLFRTLARVIPQCGMVSQAVAFNMFLAFFPVLLVLLGLITTAAIHYALARWDAFVRYCDDGRIEIDNSAAERALRVVAIGRRNYLFAGS